MTWQHRALNQMISIIILIGVGGWVRNFLTTFHCFKNIFNEELERSGVCSFRLSSSAEPLLTNNTVPVRLFLRGEKVVQEKEIVSRSVQTIGFISEFVRLRLVRRIYQNPANPT